MVTMECPRLDNNWRIPDALWQRPRTHAAGAQAPAQESRAQAAGMATGDRRHLLRVADRLPVESGTARVRLWKQSASLLPETGRRRNLCAAVAGGPRRIRRTAGHPVGVAEHRRDHDEGPTRWGEKPGPIPPIERNREPNGRCLPMAPGCRWASPSAAPTPMTNAWSRRPCRAFPWSGPNRHRARSNTSARIRATTIPTCGS